MLTAAPSVTAEILLLEQNDDEVAVFEEATGTNHLNVVADCPTILRFLRRQGDQSQAPRPDLILLDLDLSDKIGCEMLSEIKQDPTLRRIPVVVLAASDSYDNIFQAYDLQANAYVRKPDEKEQLITVLRVTLHFWLSLARLPRE
ncbi:MAG TPA: response regulator [Bryobacteraceae bacterium]|nr:response regulator [Bryobacteraceae bacterium]